METTLLCGDYVYITFESIAITQNCYRIENVDIFNKGVLQIAGDKIKGNVKEVILPILNTILINW